jgi:hypothetical protein
VHHWPGPTGKVAYHSAANGKAGEPARLPMPRPVPRCMLSTIEHQITSAENSRHRAGSRREGSATMERLARILVGLVIAIVLVGVGPRGADAAASFSTPSSSLYVGPHGQIARSGTPGKYGVPPVEAAPLVTCAYVSDTQLWVRPVDVTVRAPKIARSLPFVFVHPDTPQAIRWRVTVSQVIDPAVPLLPVLTTADRAGLAPVGGSLPIGWDSVTIPALPDGPVYLIGFEIEWLDVDGDILGSIGYLSHASLITQANGLPQGRVTACPPKAPTSNFLLARVNQPGFTEDGDPAVGQRVNPVVVGQDVTYTLKRFPLNVPVHSLLCPYEINYGFCPDADLVDSTVTEADGFTDDGFVFPTRPQGYYRLRWETENAAWRESHPIFRVEPALEADVAVSGETQTLRVQLTGHCAGVDLEIVLTTESGEDVRFVTGGTDDTGSADLQIEIPSEVPAGTATVVSRTKCSDAKDEVKIRKLRREVTPIPTAEAVEADATAPATEEATALADERQATEESESVDVTPDATVDGADPTSVDETPADSDEIPAQDAETPAQENQAPTQETASAEPPIETPAAEPVPTEAPVEEPPVEQPSEAEATGTSEEATEEPTEAAG